MGRLSAIVRTRETYFEKIQSLSYSSINTKKIALYDFDKFVKKEFDMNSCEEMIAELRNEDETVLYDVLQKWINSLDLQGGKLRFCKNKSRGIINEFSKITSHNSYFHTS